MPEFAVNLESFKISKHCITEYQYTQFILANGYENTKYYCPKGLNWLKKNIYYHYIGILFK